MLIILDLDERVLYSFKYSDATVFSTKSECQLLYLWYYLRKDVLTILRWGRL